MSEKYLVRSMCDSVNNILKAQFVTANGNMDNLSEYVLELAITVLYSSVNCDQTDRCLYSFQSW